MIAPQKPLDRRRKPDAPRQPASPTPREHLPAPAADLSCDTCQAPTQAPTALRLVAEQSLRSVTPVLARTLTIPVQKGFPLCTVTIRHAPWSASPDPRRCAAARSGRPGARARARASVAAARSNRAVLARPLRAARRAPAPRARAARPDLRQVRPGAVDAARPAAARHRRRARASCRTACRRSRPTRSRDASSARSAGRSTRCSSLRRDAGGERVDRAGALRRAARTAREVAVKVLRPGMLAGDRGRPRADAHGARADRAAVAPTASG